MERTEVQNRSSFDEPVTMTILRSLLMREGGGEEQEPITWKEFCSGIALVLGALISFALLIRIFGD